MIETMLRSVTLICFKIHKLLEFFMGNSITRFIIGNSKKIILLFLIISILFTYSASDVSMESNLDQFESDSPKVKAREYIQENFTISNHTTVQVIIKKENVLDKSTLLDILNYQKKLEEDELVNSTLTQEQSIVSIANYIAINSISNQKIEEIENKSTKIKYLRSQISNQSSIITQLLNESRQIQTSIDELNASYKRNEINESIYQKRLSSYQHELEKIRESANENLSTSQYQSFLFLQNQVIEIQNQMNLLNQEYQQGLINETIYQREISKLSQEMKDKYKSIPSLFNETYNRIQEISDQIDEIRNELEESPSLNKQIDQLSQLNKSQLKTRINEVFSGQFSESDFDPFLLMPQNFNAETGEANSTMIIVRQREINEESIMTSEKITDSQKRIKELGTQEVSNGNVMVLGQGIITEEIDQSMDDSLNIVLPLALFFVLLVLIIAYRDILDIILGLFGILLVLIWTFGAMGLLDISFNQMFIAIPALLTGLSVDFAIHVIMRNREEREKNPNEEIHKSMRIALASVGVALLWVTTTTMIGFLSNLCSPIPPIREFGLISSFGIFSALLVLGIFVPALKVELDSFLEGKGLNRRKRAFGSSGITKKALSIGSYLAKKKPYIVIFFVLLITLAGAYGATKVDTTFGQRDFLAEEPPEWMNNLPQQIRPGEYNVKQNLDFINQNYPREDQKAQILIKGDVDTSKALLALDEAHKLLNKCDVTVKLSGNKSRVESTLKLIKETSISNESFNKTYKASDTNDDGVPDQNVTALFQELQKISPEQTQRLTQIENNEYKALRLIISIKGDSEFSEVNEEISEVADSIEKPGLETAATGDPIVFDVIETNIFDTVIDSLIIALVSVFLFITIGFRILEGSATLGFLTLLPVLFITIWIIGTMYVLNISFNVMTALITNLTIGLGIDYSIHISERFKQEFIEKNNSLSKALDKTIVGTGGALLSSALTTIGGFGVLALSILPPIKNFGMITAITLTYSFIGGVFVLPSLLTIWVKMQSTKEKEIGGKETKEKIEISELTKTYGEITALKGINLDLNKTVLGLVGPNGAGKTTLLKILSGEIKDYAGKVKIHGKDIKESIGLKEKIGYLPEEPGFYEEMTGNEFLRYMSTLKGSNKYDSSKKAYKWLEKVDLEEWGNQKIKNYSKGMKQRLGIAHAFMNDPEVILLDEPTKDLDPVARENVLELINDFSKEEKTIIISSHVLSELKEVVEDIVIIKNGSIIAKTEINDINNLEKYYRTKIGK